MPNHVPSASHIILETISDENLLDGNEGYAKVGNNARVTPSETYLYNSGVR